MGQAAYDYNTVRRRKAPQTQRKANLRVAKGGKRTRLRIQANNGICNEKRIALTKH